MTFNTKLINLLKTDPRFVDDEGELVLAAVQDYAWKINHDLVKLLLSDNEIKAKFFDEIEGHWIFNLNTFIDYISQKNFLNNSYTRFRNRIGLTIAGKYLRERGEVALVWPYKDCVLEGGQTKEEEKRKEIFFNEVLAQDEINRLLDPKVLTNFTHYTAKGKEKVTGFKRDENGVIRENLIIKGNNLLALHTLKTQFRGQVKLIYIDPPYNTGNDSFGYNDSFNHSTWLTFMKNRLEVARELLAPDGVIFISCDDNEQAYLRVIMDEVFGLENFVANIVAQTNPRGRTLDKFLAKTFEYLIVFTRSIGYDSLFRIPKSERALGEYKQVDKWGVYRELELRNRNPVFTRSNRRNLYFPIYVNPENGAVSLQKDNTFTETALPTNSRGEDGCWTWGQKKVSENINLLTARKASTGVWRIFRKDYIPAEGAFTKEKALWLDKTINHENGKEELGRLFGKSPFAFPKSVELIKKILQISTRSNRRQIVLDFHAGSGTTAHAVLELNKEDGGNRQFILVEQMDYIETVTRERVRKVIEQQGGGDFIYCELMKYNEAFMERIQSAKSTEELVQIWREMAEGSFLNWYINPEMPEEAVRDFEALGQEPNGLEKQKHLLAELLDKNQLYVNLSEIDDAQFNVSEEDKALNKAFYGDSL